jgi:hypothetical protein
LSEREKSSVAEMLGEFFRELAILILVFVPLQSFRSANSQVRVLLEMIGATLLVSSGFLLLGIAIERGRR